MGCRVLRNVLRVRTVSGEISLYKESAIPFRISQHSPVESLPYSPPMADLLLFLVLALQLFFVTGTELTKRNDDVGLITIKNGNFVTCNGRQVDQGSNFGCHILNAEVFHSSYRFYGTNAYWVQMLTDDDMERVFHDIATADLQVVRIWAFNDVAQKPSSGTYFQVLYQFFFFISLQNVVLIAVIDPAKWPSDGKRRTRWLAALGQSRSSGCQV